MELRSVQAQDVAAMREERRRGLSLGFVPAFYARLAEEARPHLFQDVGPGGKPAGAIGYALLLEREHQGHTHVTVLELHLQPGQQHRYEEALDLLREKKGPTTYLARTDDCLYDATLLSRGLQVEPTALVLLADGLGGGAPAPMEDAPQLEVVPLAPGHMDAIRRILQESGARETGEAGEKGEAEHQHGRSRAEMLAELEEMAGAGAGWTLLRDGSPSAVVAREDAADGVHELVDFALAQGSEAQLAWALQQAARAVAAEGRRPAAVIDALETARHRLFREAGFHTAAAYLVFYDPDAGRPSVPRIDTDELRALLMRGEKVALLDVLGEEHWELGHIPGAGWIDFKGLAREARHRFKKDDPIIVYCNGFT